MVILMMILMVILIDPNGDPNDDPNGKSYWIIMEIQVDHNGDPNGSFRILHIFPEFLAAFRLKDFQSCSLINYLEIP